MTKFWEDTQGGITAKCEYDHERHEYLITVSSGALKLERRFRASWEPRFGMDVVDAQESQRVAEQLAQEIEAEMRGR